LLALLIVSNTSTDWAGKLRVSGSTVQRVMVKSGSRLTPCSEIVWLAPFASCRRYSCPTRTPASVPGKLIVAPVSPATAAVAVMLATVPTRVSTAAPPPEEELPVVTDQAVRRSTRISRMASTGPWQTEVAPEI